MSEVEAQELRRVAGHFPTGVTVVTATHGGRPCGMTVNSFASVSLEPPLVLVCLAHAARAYACVDAAGRFAVNVLAEGQEAVARAFASKVEDKFADVAYRTSPHGSPILDGAHAWLDCEVVARHPGGRTHTIYVARVVALAAGRGHPLVFHAGQYRGLGPATTR
ncbi:MAG: flavin reductase family protein [Chloroflexota bacterium]|nr:flavin reductase family protein [Chloroflexota bacterium]MDE3194477.1 flavin reductase family protein [Chloroflexota bacterium]